MAIETADTVWVLISSALVLLMVPGLALFYGGLVQRKNVRAMVRLKKPATPAPARTPDRITGVYITGLE